MVLSGLLDFRQAISVRLPPRLAGSGQAQRMLGQLGGGGGIAVSDGGWVVQYQPRILVCPCVLLKGFPLRITDSGSHPVWLLTSQEAQQAALQHLQNLLHAEGATLSFGRLESPAFLRLRGYGIYQLSGAALRQSFRSL